MQTGQMPISVIMAAGRGSRMREYPGNKTLLPLIPENSPYEGRLPMLVHILNQLPQGPKAIVVHHCMAEVKSATRALTPTYCFQPQLNGTGGALLAAREFIEAQPGEAVIVTMGDVPLVKSRTYTELLSLLKNHHLAVLGFSPEDKREYGVLETQGDQVRRIVESKYWKQYPADQQARLQVCNAGIYAARKDVLLKYLAILASRPHRIQKEIDGELTEIEEFFMTDIVEYICQDGLQVGYRVTPNPDEVMGVDDVIALQKVQDLYHRQPVFP